MTSHLRLVFSQLLRGLKGYLRIPNGKQTAPQGVAGSTPVTSATFFHTISFRVFLAPIEKSRPVMDDKTATTNSNFPVLLFFSGS
jgi:hypothetical protein